MYVTKIDRAVNYTALILISTLILFGYIKQTNMSDTIITSLFVGLSGALLGGVLTILGVYINHYLVNSKEIKDKTIQEKTNIKSFKTLLSSTFLTSIEKNLLDIEAVSTKISNGNKYTFTYIFYDSVYLSLPINTMFNDSFFKETLLKTGIEYDTISNFFIYIGISQNNSLSTILKIYNENISNAYEFHNKTYQGIYTLFKDIPDTLEFEISQLNTSTDDTIKALNDNTIEELAKTKEALNSLKENILSTLAMLKNY